MATKRRILPPLFGKARMLELGLVNGFAHYALPIRPLPLTIVIEWYASRWNWQITISSTKNTITRGTATGPQAAANAAKRTIEKWGEIVRKI